MLLLLFKDYSDDEFHRRLVNFILLTDQPFSIVESSGFRDLFMFSNMNVNFVGRKGIKSKILRMYGEKRDAIHSTLAVNLTYI